MVAQHRGRRCARTFTPTCAVRTLGAPKERRDDSRVPTTRGLRRGVAVNTELYLREEQRSEARCSAGRMPAPLSRRVAEIAIVAGVVSVVSGPWAAAQVAQPPTATHKHYESAPQASQPGPNGELAPRLQNLGTHTFPVSTKRADV